MKELKALEILKFMSKGILDFDYKEDCNEAIAELEALDNRSCENCKYDYVDINANCERCNRYHDDKFELKASK